MPESNAPTEQPEPEPKGHSGRANADDVIVAELACGKSVREAAQAAGVSERTVARRLTQPEFRERVQAQRAALVSAAGGRLAGAMGKAADTLAALLDNDTASVRLRAADRLIELGLKVTELVELQKRVEALEAQLAHATKESAK